MSARLCLVVASLFTVLSGCTCGVPGTTCSTEQDCTNPAAPKCDDKGLCAACVLDEHCAEGFLCLNGACEPGCRSDNDRCPMGVCKPGAGCVACVLDSQCGAGMVCANNACVPGCSAQNPACPSGLVCDTTRGQCVECLDSSGCPNAPLTRLQPHHAHLRAVREPTPTASIRRGPVCDPSSSTCVGCLSNTDCPNNGVCNQQRCVQCLSDAQCGGATPALQRRHQHLRGLPARRHRQLPHGPVLPPRQPLRAGLQDGHGLPLGRVPAEPLVPGVHQRHAVRRGQRLPERHLRGRVQRHQPLRRQPDLLQRPLREPAGRPEQLRRVRPDLRRQPGVLRRHAASRPPR